MQLTLSRIFQGERGGNFEAAFAEDGGSVKPTPAVGGRAGGVGADVFAASSRSGG